MKKMGYETYKKSENHRGLPDGGVNTNIAIVKT